jgi:hypothetical protein
VDTNGSPASGAGPLRPGKRFAIAMGLVVVLCLVGAAAVMAAGRRGSCYQSQPPSQVCEGCQPCGLWGADQDRPDPHASSCGSYGPAGPITRQQAIEIATGLSAFNGQIVPSTTAGYDERFGRWVWHVSWAYSAGPTSGESCDVVVDYNTGRILDRACAHA